MPTKSELILQLKELGVKGYSRKNKPELQAMVDAAVAAAARKDDDACGPQDEDEYPVMDELYAPTIAETLRVAQSIPITRSAATVAAAADGRIDSATKEGPFLEALQRQLLELHPTWTILISPPRASCDIMINGIRINLKLTDCKSADNSVNKPSIFYSITGQTSYPYSSTWNEFRDRLLAAKEAGRIKRSRHRPTEYHYLVKNKLTGDVLLKSIFDIHTYVSNPSNDLQINWRNEFENVTYTVPDTDADYRQKVESLLRTLQQSVAEMIARTQQFAIADLRVLLG
jgi:hypothetical protein